MDTWILRNPAPDAAPAPADPLPTEVNCWEAVLHVAMAAALVSRAQMRAAMGPELSSREVFTALFPVVLGEPRTRVDAAPPVRPGDVLEYVARSAPAAIGACEHVALVNETVAGRSIELIELDSTRGARRLHVVRNRDVLTDLATHHPDKGPWGYVIRRFHRPDL